MNATLKSATRKSRHERLSPRRTLRSMKPRSTCCTCGYSWPTGQDGSHQCSEYLSEDLKEARELLKECAVALDDWINTYASEFCDKKRVKEAYERISEGGGTLAYIAGIRQKIRAVIDRVRIT